MIFIKQRLKYVTRSRPMEFEFDKFVQDIEKRQNQNNESRRSNTQEQDLDYARRLRARQYHERWQNRIVWENK